MRITGITFIRSIGDIQKSRMMGKFHTLLQTAQCIGVYGAQCMVHNADGTQCV